MNTKTMRLPPRRVLTADKRKERDSVTEKPPPIAGKMLPPPPINPILRNPPIKPAEPVGSNNSNHSNQVILAGYLSHEFLTNGTLFGEQWNPARAQAGPFSAQSVEPSLEESEPKRKRYKEVTNLLRSDGAHLPGIVNPAQLARFLKL